MVRTMAVLSASFQSPQWGDSSKVNDEEIISAIDTIMFQSPQWGDNSKGEEYALYQK